MSCLPFPYKKQIQHLFLSQVNRQYLLLSFSSTPTHHQQFEQCGPSQCYLQLCLYMNIIIFCTTVFNNAINCDSLYPQEKNHLLLAENHDVLCSFFLKIIYSNLCLPLSFPAFVSNCRFGLSLPPLCFPFSVLELPQHRSATQYPALSQSLSHQWPAGAFCSRYVDPVGTESSARPLLAAAARSVWFSIFLTSLARAEEHFK